MTRSGVEIAVELYALAEAMLRKRLEREHPEWSRARLEKEVNRWRTARPGAEHGDSPGPVARAGHLIAMKLLARDDRERPQDLDDIRALLLVATPADRRLVTTAIKQIAKRGSHGAAISMQHGAQ